MKSFIFRRWSLILSVVVIFGAIQVKKILAGKKAEPAHEEVIERAAAVSVLEVQNTTQLAEVKLSGPIYSSQKIEVFSEVTGKVLYSGKAFKDGIKFKKGETLLELDASDFRMTLNASRSNFQSALVQSLAEIKVDYPDEFGRWQDYLQNFDPENELYQLPDVESDQFERFLISRNLYNQFFAIKSQEVKLNKYTLFAPFDGVVSNAIVNPGFLVRAGQKLGDFIATESFEMECGIPLNKIELLETGDEVVLRNTEIEGAWKGHVSRLGKYVDSNTQTVKVYVDISSANLLEGMYLSGFAGAQMKMATYRIRRHLLINPNQVYVIRDGLLALQTVEVLHRMGDEVLVSGIPDGALLVDQTIPGAFVGMRVKIAKA